MCAAYNKAQGAGPNDKIIIMCTVTTTSTCKSHCPASTLCMVSFIACNAPYSPYACVPNAVHCMPCFHPDSCAKLYFYQSCCMPLEPTVTWYLKPNPLQMLYQSVTRVKRSSSSCKVGTLTNVCCCLHGRKLRVRVGGVGAGRNEAKRNWKALVY